MFRNSTVLNIILISAYSEDYYSEDYYYYYSEDYYYYYYNFGDEWSKLNFARALIFHILQNLLKYRARSSCIYKFHTSTPSTKTCLQSCYMQ